MDVGSVSVATSSISTYSSYGNRAIGPCKRNANISLLACHLSESFSQKPLHNFHSGLSSFKPKILTVASPSYRVSLNANRSLLSVLQVFLSNTALLTERGHWVQYSCRQQGKANGHRITSQIASLLRTHLQLDSSVTESHGYCEPKCSGTAGSQGIWWWWAFKDRQAWQNIE